MCIVCGNKSDTDICSWCEQAYRWYEEQSEEKDIETDEDYTLPERN